ncbi:MAG TPA: hypothetical protein VG735_04785 [Caulobacterales bacterium]|jgi:hypothetical protein|nr:hypothetical protein [Caulobacterales bacterium]
MAEAIFKGVSGRLHRFSAFAPQAAMPAGPAVYAFARPGPGGKGWTTLFLSRTANLAQRMARHELWAEARRLGATHILIHQRHERDAREAVEADLLAALRPALNGPLDAARAIDPPAKVVRLKPASSFVFARAARA